MSTQKSATSIGPHGLHPAPPVVTPAWAGLVQQVLHLAQFGGSIQVVYGSSGAGKTTFLSVLIDQNDPGLVSYKVPPECSLATLFRALLQALGLRPPEQASAGELISALRSHGQSLERTQARAIIVLDDAHFLGASQLAALTSVLQGHQDSGFGLHFVLLGEAGLAERIDQLQLVDISVHDVQLPPFSKNELKTLLQAHEQEQGVPFSLNAEQLQHVWDKSAGLPGRALAISADLNPVTPQTATVFSLNGWPLGHFAALGLLCGLLVWAVLFRSESPMGEIEEASVRPSTGANQVAPPRQQGEVERDSLAGRIERSVEADPKGTESLRGSGSAIEHLKVETSPEAHRNLVDVTPPVVSEPDAVADEAPAQVVVAPRSLKDVVHRDQQKLMAMPSTGYMLQLMALRELDGVHQFVDKQTNQESLLIYQADRDNRPMYILVTGVYADRGSAVAAITNLPASLRKARPWPRSLAEIHREIEK